MPRKPKPPPPPPPPDPPAGVSPPSTIKADGSVDVTTALLSWLETVPNGATVSFPSTARYRIEGTLLLNWRQGLVFEGNGCTFFSQNPMVSGNWDHGQRAMWRLVGCTGIKFNNMTIDGAYTKGGVHDESLQYAHGIDLRGTQCDISNVTMTDLAGDGVLFGLNYFDEVGRSSGSVKNCTILRTGRNGVAVTAANDVLVQGVTTDVIGLIAFDVEPDPVRDGAGNGTARITFDSNTIGSYYLWAYAIVESAANDDQRFTGNRATGPMRIGIVDPGNFGARPKRVTISGNTAGTTPSPAMSVRNVDTLTVTGNAIPTTTMLQHTGVTNLTFSGNTPNTKVP